MRIIMHLTITRLENTSVEELEKENLQPYVQ